MFTAIKRITVNGIKTIIFDLGGVIIDLEVQKTVAGFAAMSDLSSQQVTNLYVSHPTFLTFETGQITETVFRAEVRELLGRGDVTDDMIDRAWNAMLVGLPKDKINLLQRLQSQYQVMILSNTNTIHIDYVYRHMLPLVSEATSFDQLAHKVYYSHIMGLRKPDPAIYQRVLDENNLLAEETLFLDDNADNIKGASSLGIVVRQVTHPDQVYQILA